MRYFWLSAVCLILASPAVAAAGHPLSKAEMIQQRAAAAMHEKEASTCVLQSISCGQVIHGSLDPGDCLLQDGSAIDFFQFNGTAGQQVTGTLDSTAFTPFLTLLDATPTVQASNTSVGSTQILFTLNSSGVWTWGVNNNQPFFEAGNYTLQFQCGSSNANCTADDHTLCLSSSRFKVTATFDAGNGNAGNAHAVTLTSDTGYLWFFASTAVEAVVKVIDGCGLGGHYWVFAGGLTNAAVTLTVTDTLTNKTRTYNNPPNTEYQPIQDTSAFSTCP
jgi:hypothetical protein